MGVILGASDSVWSLLIIPMLTVVFIGLGAAAAFYPHWKDRAQKAQERADREARLDRTMDHVLGCEADPRTGKPAVVGLIEMTPRLAEDCAAMRETIGRVHSGMTVMGSLAEANRKIEHIGLGQATLSETVDAHMILDDNRFRDTNRELGAQRHELDGLRKDLNGAVKGIRETVVQVIAEQRR